VEFYALEPAAAREVQLWTLDESEAGPSGGWLNPGFVHKVTSVASLSLRAIVLSCRLLAQVGMTCAGGSTSRASSTAESMSIARPAATLLERFS
jgi:hypothetical protein